MADFMDDLDNELDDFEFDDPFASPPPPKNAREAIEQSLTSGFKGFSGSFTGDYSDTAKNILRSAIPMEARRETSEVLYVASDLNDEIKRAGREVKVGAKKLLKNTDKYLPKEGVSGSLVEKLKNAVGFYDEDSSGGREPTKEEIASRAAIETISTVLGERSERDKVEELINRSIQHKKDTNALEISKIIAANTEQLVKFNTDITDANNRLSLELKYKSIFLQKEQLEVTKAGFDTSIKQLESIIRNTGLPDFVKLKSTEALKAKLRDQLLGKKVDFLFKEGGWASRLQQKGLRKIRTLGSSVASGLTDTSEAIEGAETINDLSEMAGGKSGMFGGLLGGLLQTKIGLKLGEKLYENEKIRERLYKAKEAYIDPGEYFKEKEESSEGKAAKLYSILAKTFSYTPEEERLSVEQIDPDSPYIFDKRTHTSINVVIPGLLSKILSAVETGQGKEASDLRFNYARKQFMTGKESKDAFYKDIESKYISTRSAESMDDIMGYFTTGKNRTEVQKVKYALTKYMMDGNSLNPDSLLKDDFINYIDEDYREDVRKRLAESLTDENPDRQYAKKFTLNDALTRIRNVLPNPQDMANDYIDSGNLDILEKEGLITYDQDLKRFEFNKEKYRDKVAAIYSKQVSKAAMDKIKEESTISEDDEVAIAVREKRDKLFEFIGDKLKTSNKDKLGASDIDGKSSKLSDKITKSSKTVQDFIKNLTVSDVKDYIEKQEGKVEDFIKDTTGIDRNTVLEAIDENYKKIEESDNKIVSSLRDSVKKSYSKIKDTKDYINNNDKETIKKDLKSKLSSIEKSIENFSKEDVTKYLEDGTGKIETYLKDNHNIDKTSFISVLNDNYKKIEESDNKIVSSLRDTVSDISNNKIVKEASEYIKKIDKETLKEDLKTVKDNVSNLTKEDVLKYIEDGEGKISEIITDAKTVDKKTILDFVTKEYDTIVKKEEQLTSKFKAKILKDSEDKNTVTDIYTSAKDSSKDLFTKFTDKFNDLINDEKEEDKEPRKGSWITRLEELKNKKTESNKVNEKPELKPTKEKSNLMGLLGLISGGVGLIGKVIKGALGGAGTVIKLLSSVSKGVFSVGSLVAKSLGPIILKLGSSLLTGLPKLLMGAIGGMGTVGGLVGKGVKGAGSLVGSGLSGLASLVDKVSGKSAGKTAVKGTAKVAGKSIGKSLLKKIPGLGVLAGLGFGASRALEGDWLGGLGELGSGALGLIPGIGTAGSLGIDAWLAKRDHDKANQQPEPTTINSKLANNQNYFPELQEDMPIKKQINQAAVMTGVDPVKLQTFAAVESGMNPDAKAKTSSAKGLFQFTDSTWKDMINKYGSKYGLDETVSPFNPLANSLMAGEYIKENEKQLKSVKDNVNTTDLYLAHFLGAGGAKKFLAANRHMGADTVVPYAAKANQSIFYTPEGRARTVGNVYSLMGRKLYSKARAFGIGTGITPDSLVANADKVEMPNVSYNNQTENTGVKVPDATSIDKTTIDNSTKVASASDIGPGIETTTDVSTKVNNKNNIDELTDLYTKKNNVENNRKDATIKTISDDMLDSVNSNKQLQYINRNTSKMVDLQTKTLAVLEAILKKDNVVKIENNKEAAGIEEKPKTTPVRPREISEMTKPAVDVSLRRYGA